MYVCMYSSAVPSSNVFSPTSTNQFYCDDHFDHAHLVRRIT